MSITTNALNRLRAASGLIPLIEDGLNTSQMPPEKAAAMAIFCQWTLQDTDNSIPEVAKLVERIQQGLARIQEQLLAANVAPSPSPLVHHQSLMAVVSD